MTKVSSPAASSIKVY